MSALRAWLWFWQLITQLSYFSQAFLPNEIKNFLFLLWVNLYMITGMYLHDPSPFNGPFFMTPPFSGSQKVVTLPLFPSPLPLLISDKSLMAARLLWRSEAAPRLSRKRSVTYRIVLVQYFVQCERLFDLFAEVYKKERGLEPTETEVNTEERGLEPSRPTAPVRICRHDATLVPGASWSPEYDFRTSGYFWFKSKLKNSLLKALNHLNLQSLTLRHEQVNAIRNVVENQKWPEVLKSRTSNKSCVPRASKSLYSGLQEALGDENGTMLDVRERRVLLQASAVCTIPAG